MCRQQFDKAGMKFMAVVVAALYILAGIVMLGFGISIKATPRSFQNHYDYTGLDLNIVRGDVLEKSAEFLIAVSCISIVSGAFVIFAVISENLILLKISSLILAALIVAGIVMIIFTAAYPPQEIIRGQMRLTSLTDFNAQDVKTNGSIITSYPPENTEPYAWAYTQINTQCCGIDGPKDYEFLPDSKRSETIPPSLNQTVLRVPLSCCRLVNKAEFLDLRGCVRNNVNATNQKGCLRSVLVYYGLSALTVYRMAPILIAFQIGLIAFQLKLSYDLNNYQSME